jgi:TMEM175 potassium channel family protein
VVGRRPDTAPDRTRSRAAEPSLVSTGRLEAFSDGVIAVAITLLVLDITVPPMKKGMTLAHQLAQMWPNYAAYVISFITIGIIWVNHHAMISRLSRVDRTILMLNLLLLLSIGVLPFATALMAAYLRESQGEHLAAAIYSGAFLFMAILYASLNRHILLVKSHLMAPQLPAERRRQILRRSISGLVPYTVATALAVVSPYVTLAICGAVAAFYASPLGSGGDTEERESDGE